MNVAVSHLCGKLNYRAEGNSKDRIRINTEKELVEIYFCDAGDHCV